MIEQLCARHATVDALLDGFAAQEAERAPLAPRAVADTPHVPRTAAAPAGKEPAVECAMAVRRQVSGG